MVVTLTGKPFLHFFCYFWKKLFVSRQIHIFELSLIKRTYFFLHLSFRLGFELSSNRQWLNYARIIIFWTTIRFAIWLSKFSFYFIYDFKFWSLLISLGYEVQINLKKISTTITNYALHEEGGKKLTAVNLQILRNLWLPDVEILNLKAFETHKVLSKLEGVWLDEENHLIYALATRITFICPMKFNAFPMDIQRCKFQVSPSSLN